MGLLSRWSVRGSMLLVLSCATIAGIEEPDPVEVIEDAGGSPTSAAPSPSSSSSTPEGGRLPSEPPAPDAALTDGASDDAPPPPPVCQEPKKPNGSPCAAPAECCSNACSEKAKCRDECKSSELAFCSPFEDDCCIGMFCAAGLPPLCKKCRPSGSAPEGNDLKSCCSRTLDTNGNCL